MDYREYFESAMKMTDEEVARIALSQVKEKLDSARDTLGLIEKCAEKLADSGTIELEELILLINEAGLISHSVIYIMTMMCVKVGMEGLIR